MKQWKRLTSTSLSPRSNLWNHTSVPDDEDDDDDDVHDDDVHDVHDENYHWVVIHASILSQCRTPTQERACYLRVRSPGC